MSEMIQGDALSVLRERFANESVQCVVTSPPYWGLRDYNVEGRLGLEKTPEEYVAKMVEVFREVRRVLKPNGTCFINLGDSYFSNPGNGRGGGSTLSGAKPHLSGVARVVRSDSDGKGKRGSSVYVSTCENLCGGCAASLASRSLDNDTCPASGHVTSPSSSIRARKGLLPVRQDNFRLNHQADRNAAATLDSSPVFSHAHAQPVSSQESMQRQSLPRLQDECLHCSNCDACLAVLASSLRESQLCARKKVGPFVSRSVPSDVLETTVVGDNRSGIVVTGGASDGRTSDKSFGSSSYLDSNTVLHHLKPKDLVGIPWRIAFALQADGWWLRSDIIWSKTNPMPESVQDRPTRAHEYLFLLSKSKRYYYDAGAIQEPMSMSSVERLSQPNLENQIGSDRVPFKTNGNMQAVGKIDKQRGHGRRHDGFNDRWDAMEKAGQCSGMRNKRSVWTIATQPYLEAHFATFPKKLVEPCILAGCPVGGLVLDPFAGSGTVLVVAKQLGRQAVGIELNADYIAMAEKRLTQEVLSL